METLFAPAELLTALYAWLADSARWVLYVMLGGAALKAVHALLDPAANLGWAVLSAVAPLLALDGQLEAVTLLMRLLQTAIMGLLVVAAAVWLASRRSARGRARPMAVPVKADAFVSEA